MGLLEKLRPQPRWKHADPSVRAAAVYELTGDDADADALIALAREDADARVRRAAVSRVIDPDLLADVARTDPDEDVRAEAVRGLAGIAAEAEQLDVVLPVLRHLSELGRLREIVAIARTGSAVEVRSGAEGSTFITRGDNNNYLDAPVPESSVEGRVVLVVPKLGLLPIAVKNWLAE